MHQHFFAACPPAMQTASKAGTYSVGPVEHEDHIARQTIRQSRDLGLAHKRARWNCLGLAMTPFSCDWSRQAKNRVHIRVGAPLLGHLNRGAARAHKVLIRYIAKPCSYG